jgi:hypothetical protein
VSLLLLLLLLALCFCCCSSTVSPLLLSPLPLSSFSEWRGLQLADLDDVASGFTWISFHAFPSSITTLI